MKVMHPDVKLRMSEWCEMVNGSDFGMDSALVLAKCVQEDLPVLDVVSWATWVGVAPGGYHDGLIYATEAGDGSISIVPLKRLWAYGNYTRFLHPGYVRVDVTGAQELLPVAFEGLQDGRMQRVIILINESAEPRSASLEGCTEGFTALQVHETSDAHDLDKVYDGPVLPSVTLPGRSVVTLVLHA